MTLDLEQARLIVVDEIKKLLRDSSRSIHGHDTLLHDLNLDGDDLSFEFVPNVERRCGVVVSREAWSTVYTVDDVIELIASSPLASPDVLRSRESRYRSMRRMYLLACLIVVGCVTVGSLAMFGRDGLGIGIVAGLLVIVVIGISFPLLTRR